MDKFSVQSDTSGDVAIVTAAGRVDSETAPQFDAELTKVTAEKSKIVLDLKGVEYMSSAGVRAIVKAAQAVEKNGGAIKLASVPELINSVLYTVGLNQKVGSFASVDEATASF